MKEEGFVPLTWNGCSFDFFVLAQESGLYDECSRLAMDHVDLMLIVTFTKGWYLSLEKALRGAGLGGKKSTVKLSDGSTLTDMGGAEAPKLWAEGEYEAVLSYLREDVHQLMRLGQHVERTRAIRWTSNAGNPQFVSVPRLLTVRECFDLPEPDVSWMDDPPRREDFMAWMP